MMPSHNTRGKSTVSGSSPKGVATPANGVDAQLSATGRVNPNVSSFAMDRGVLAATSIGTPPKVEADTPLYGSAEGLTDAEVMLRVKAGDDSAFDYLVQKYRRAMVHFMYRTLRNGAAAEDLAQEVFLRVYRSRSSYEASAKFTTWLYRIATNLAVNHARDTRHERPENTLSLDEVNQDTGTAVDVADRSPTAEEELVKRERLAGIREKVQSLPERQRMAVIMHKYQQMDYGQIADVMKLSESATKSLLFRAYETLREQLKEFI
jgi:RNA polymerase sigma-70 factor (ECF subfamily)